MGWTHAAFSVSVAAQAVWLPGATLLTFSVFRRSEVIGAALTTVALTGATLVNTIFTWPKLLAAGLVMASAAVCVEGLRARATRSGTTRLCWGTAGVLAGLAWQAHGVSLFAVAGLVAVLLLLPQRVLPGPRLTPPAVVLATALAVQLPWMAWQRWGDPPGDRLLKYHLSAVQSVDTRPFLQTLLDSYRELGWAGVVDYKLDNIANLFSVTDLPITPWTSLSAPEAARMSDFYSLTGALSWGLPTLFALLVFCIHTRRMPAGRPAARATLLLALWVVVSALFWSIAMFGPATTVNHQGPYVLSMAPLLLVSGWAAAAGRVPWTMGAALQVIAFVWLYALAPGMTVAHNPGWASLAAGVAVLVAVALSAIQLAPPSRAGTGRTTALSQRPENSPGGRAPVRPASRPVASVDAQ